MNSPASNPSAEIVIPILPSVPRYYTTPGPKQLDYRALCCFAATGFFLDDDTHFTNRKAFRPASKYVTGSDGIMTRTETYFTWHHSPRTLSFSDAVEEFSALFERIVAQGTAGKKVILPISGGLDSRTLAAALRNHGQVRGYSYEFENGIPENRYGKEIADVSRYPFTPFTVGKGYLWSKLEAAANVNECFSEFTHPRQIAVMDEVAKYGDLFALGHWGDVLYDDMGVPSGLTDEGLTKEIRKKVVKRGGMELARALWQQWGLSGTFDAYFDERIGLLLAEIKIENLTAKVRAFKSLHWAPRWTSVNLTFFEQRHPIFVPYYHDDICRQIATLPESYLAGRGMQIAYLKAKTPALASIPWQKYAPCNLYNYQDYYSWKRFPSRVLRKIGNTLSPPANTIRRNWELQFTGPENEQHLKTYLSSPELNQLVGKPVADTFAKAFQEDPLSAAHPVSMLLTLSLFAKQNLR